MAMLVKGLNTYFLSFNLENPALPSLPIAPTQMPAAILVQGLQTCPHYPRVCRQKNVQQCSGENGIPYLPAYLLMRLEDMTIMVRARNTIPAVALCFGSEDEDKQDIIATAPAFRH
jgi:hypothetical protein